MRSYQKHATSQHLRRRKKGGHYQNLWKRENRIIMGNFEKEKSKTKQTQHTF